MKPSHAFVLAFFLTLILTLISSAPGECDQYADYGIQLYKQHKYEDAKKYFDQSLKLSPKSDTVHYYKASCFELSRDLNGAQVEYQFVVANSSNAKLIALAKTALSRVDSQLKAKDDAKAASGGSSGTSGGSNTSGGANRSSATSMNASARASKSAAGSAAATSAATAENNSSSSNDSLEAAMSEFHRIKTDPTDVVPNETRVYFTQSGNNDILIDTQISGRDFKVILDTGAYSTMIGKNQLAQLGVRGPAGPATTSVGGVGGSRVPAWIMPLQIKVGGLKRTVQAYIADNWDSPPLLGQDFYADLEYEFDNRGHCVYFRKSKQLSASERTMYCIPFTRVGRHLAVDLESDGGRKTKMLVDTGADGIAFTMANAKELGLDIPADAQRVRSQGVGGTSDGYGFSVDLLRLGPIVQRNAHIVVTTSEDGMLGSKHGSYGLLGQGFFGGWRFTVDNRNSFLRFFH